MLKTILMWVAIGAVCLFLALASVGIGAYWQMN
jgi:hypothetical protein